MPTCTFCKQAYNFPRGTTVVQKDASVKYFCSSKCRKNSEMGRLNKKVKWIVKSDLVKEDKAKKQASYEVRKELLESEKVEKVKKAASKKAAKAKK